MRRILLAAAPAMLVSACASESVVAPVRAARIPIPTGTAGLDRVMGQTAPALIAQFGRPVADIHEGAARKLQFESGTCVLDTYLYPQGRGEPVVTYVDARQSDGSPIDRASCVGALSLRRGGR